MQEIFDRKIKRLHKDRAAKNFNKFDYLFKESTQRIVQHFEEEIIQKFPIALDLGCHAGQFSREIANLAGIKTLVECDSSQKMLEHVGGLSLVADNELLPFKNNSFDLVVSVLDLHWTNDILGCLGQIKSILKKDGLFIASIFGGQTLKELREIWAEVDIEQKGGISPHISPFIHVKDAGMLLQKAGFSLPVASSEIVTVYYKDASELMGDLRNMGEGNGLIKRDKKNIGKEVIAQLTKKYADKYSNSDGKIAATFEFVTLTGWKN